MGRGFELIFAGFLMVTLLPVMVLVGIAVLVADGRPVIYRARRIGAGGREFAMLKFRTMANCGGRGVTGGDKLNRITPVGRILRRLRLDELPQLWNILRGDLAFVGPRPPAPEYFAAAPDLYGRIFTCFRPGVTGLATLSFHIREEAILAGGTTAAEVDALYRNRCIPRKARIDLLYLRNRSLGTDLWLIALTSLKVIGISARGRLWRKRPRYAVAKAQATSKPKSDWGRLPPVPINFAKFE